MINKQKKKRFLKKELVMFLFVLGTLVYMYICAEKGITDGRMFGAVIPLAVTLLVNLI